MLRSVLFGFDEVVADSVLNAVELFVGGEYVVEHGAVGSGNVLGRSQRAECNGENQECDGSFHVLFC